MKSDNALKYHEPVLLQESIDALITDPDGIYVDATYGGGGHSKEILKRLKKGKLIAFDQDEDVLRLGSGQALENQISDERFMFIRSNFRYIKNFLQFNKMLHVTGVLADLGISSHQVDEGERGFSIRYEAELDMRMNRKSKRTAKEIINEYSEGELQRVFSEYGELQRARSMARKIVDERERKAISTTKELMTLLESQAERGAESKFFAKLFQALRIEVNEELEALQEFLFSCNDIIDKDGRLVVISYHSLEDRIVKNFISDKNVERDVLTGRAKETAFLALNKKPVEPSEEEVESNPRARSAKMRVAVKN